MKFLYICVFLETFSSVINLLVLDPLSHLFIYCSFEILLEKMVHNFYIQKFLGYASLLFILMNVRIVFPFSKKHPIGMLIGLH